VLLAAWLACTAGDDLDNYQVGKSGWVTLRFPAGESPGMAVLERWVDESFRLLVPKRWVAVLDQRA
jgi:hypothetical protein